MWAVVLCLHPQIVLILFFPVETKFSIYVDAKSKVTSEFVFHHVGITLLISLKS